MAKRLLPGIAALSTLTMALLTMAQAEAVELGNITLQSASGQPLLATVQLTDVEGLSANDIRVSVASQSDFDRFSLERLGALDSLQISVDLSGTSPVLRLSSPLTINEPFVSLVLDTRWPAGRMLTEYTIRLESPAFSSQTGAQSSVAPVRSMNVLQEPDEPLPAESPSAVTAPETTAAPTQAASVSSQSSASSSSVTPSATPISNASTITVNAGDTLWELALRVRPDASVSVQQTMLALQSMNPNAFIGGNINRVRRGEILQVPELSEIRRITAAEAVVEVTRQNRLLASGAANVSAQPVAAAPSQAPAGAGAQGELRVVTVDDQAADQQPNAAAAGNQTSRNAQRLSDLENRIAVREEDIARLDSENNELNARLSMLQQQIASAQELIRLRDLELARMQQTLAEQRAAAEGTQAGSPETVITMAPDAGPVQRFIQMITSNTWAMLGVVATLILLLVLVLIRRNRAAAENEAKINARNDDGMTLGNDADELLFSGVAEAAAESAGRSEEQAKSAPSGDNSDQESEFAAVMTSAASNAYQQVDEQTETIADIQDKSGSEDDWQPADLTEDETSADVVYDERFELDDTGSDEPHEVDKTEWNKPAAPSQVTDESVEDETGYSIEDTGADLDWPDAESDNTEDSNEKTATAFDEFDISAAVAEADTAASVPATPSKSSSRVADDFDDLAFLPSEDDFSDQADIDDEDEEDFNFMSDADEAATKLDLARAYIDMGDADGAREILEEVLSEGTEVQRVEAKDLLGRL
ncbi:MAG: FimV/HubP family polar landmark protein [Pseudohongiella sp.]|nr:FimV/HubP family polar landmark protein [Pseudohongiella sp.]